MLGTTNEVHFRTTTVLCPGQPPNHCPSPPDFDRLGHFTVETADGAAVVAIMGNGTIHRIPIADINDPMLLDLLTPDGNEAVSLPSTVER